MKLNTFGKIVLLFVVSIASLDAWSSTRGSHLQQICTKDSAEASYSEQCVSYINGLKEGLLIGSQTGAITTAKYTGQDKSRVKHLNDDNQAAYLDYCHQRELDADEIADEILKYLHKNRSLSHQPVAVTFLQVMQKANPITDCQYSADGYAYGGAQF